MSESSYEAFLASLESGRPELPEKLVDQQKIIETDPQQRIVTVYEDGDGVEKWGVVYDTNGILNLHNTAAQEAIAAGYLKLFTAPDGSRKVGLTKKGQHYLNEIDEYEQDEVNRIAAGLPSRKDAERARLIDVIKQPGQIILALFDAKYKTYLRNAYGLGFEFEEDPEKRICYVEIIDRRRSQKNEKVIVLNFNIPYHSKRIFDAECDQMIAAIKTRFPPNEKSASIVKRSE